MAFESPELGPSVEITIHDEHAAYLDTAHGAIDLLDEDHLKLAVVLLGTVLRWQYPDAAKAMDAKILLGEEI